MDSSRRAVESYWRSRMIDAATADEDKVTPVYKLEEICELLRCSPIGIVKEVSEFIFKRLDHKSPVVKQKALRLIKYAVGKSGVEFRREMQRNSVAIRNLFHYRGQPDPLKGDALNKAVRDTAHEAISAIFSVEDNKPAPSEDLNRRIQGFGNTNFEMPSEDKKSFLSEVVNIGSATIKQGISGLAQGHGLGGFTQGQSQKKNDNGSYKSPNLRRSLTTGSGYSDSRYDAGEYHYEAQSSFDNSRSSAGEPWSQESRITTNGNSTSSYSESKTREERLLETIVTSGGVRLQPTRDAIQVFLVEAAKVDAVSLSHALESKLQSPQWQVRMKAICVLESILRKKDEERFSVIASYFSDNKDAVVRCSESPQASLREKAMKVLNLLGGEQLGGFVDNAERQVKAEANTTVQMPDLIDTGDAVDSNGFGASVIPQDDSKGEKGALSTTPLIDDLFGDNPSAVPQTIEQKNDDDPFADVSFHTSESKEHVEDLFSGMTVDDKPGTVDNHVAANKNGPELLDIFGPSFELPQHENDKNNVASLMDGLSPNDRQKVMSSKAISETMFADSNSNSGQQVSQDALSSILRSQTTGMSVNAMPYNITPGIILNPAFPSQPINYGSMGNFLAQQQLLATMSNFQHFGSLHTQNAGTSQVSETKGGISTPLPDIFQSNFATQMPSSTLNNSKKEESKAFDFISEHLAAARDPRRVA